MDVWLVIVLIGLFFTGITTILIATFVAGDAEAVDLVHEHIKEEDEAL